MARYVFPGHAEFRDRKDQLEAIRSWYEDPGQDPILIVHGRRRTGKSWLLREFAHDREADIFVCDRRGPLDQLERFAEQLRDEMGSVPRVNSATDFFEAVYNLGRKGRRLAVIDEFPELFGARGTPDSELAAVLEGQLGHSQTKLILCGSQVETM